MPPESSGIPGRVHYWEVPFALMLSPGWPHANWPSRSMRRSEMNIVTCPRVSRFKLITALTLIMVAILIILGNRSNYLNYLGVPKGAESRSMRCSEMNIVTCPRVRRFEFNSSRETSTPHGPTRIGVYVHLECAPRMRA